MSGIFSTESKSKGWLRHLDWPAVLLVVVAVAGAGRAIETWDIGLAAVSLICIAMAIRALRRHAIAETQLKKRDAILKAVTHGAGVLLSTEDTDAAITETLKAIGEALDISRVMVSAVTIDDDRRIWSENTYEWCGPGMTPAMADPEYRKIEVTSIRPPESLLQRFAGKEEQFLVRDIPEPIKSVMQALRVVGCITIDVIVDGKYYGHLVFCDASPKRRGWTPTEIDTLRTLTGLIGAAMARAHHLKERQKSLTGLLLRDRALEGISQGITITDDKSPGTPIIYTNPAFAALARYAMDEVIGRGPLSFFEASVAPRIVERMAQANAARKPWRMETSLKRKDGTAFLDSMVTTMIVDQNGDITHSVTIHEDVTEVRQREELLLEAQKMESVGQLTGGIAHDFNNLLTAIKSNAEDLRDDLKDNELLHSQAEIVLEAADRGAGLVAQLMAFARKQELQPKVVDVNALLDGFTKLLRSTLPAHLEIEVRKGAKLPAVYVDPGRLETAILNLAVNARDAMPDGGTVTVETSLKTLDADYVAEHIEVQQGDYVLIAVTDTGTGMKPEVVERAFTPFFTTKEVGKGTGLGLSMVYGFVKQSGGHAMIYSEVGLGTVVKIYLPALDQAAPTGDQPTKVDKANAGTGSILLVEDDPIVRQSISGKLTRLGYQVVTASHALEAIETLKGNPHFDLVFSDVIMPGPMNGADLVREVRRRWPEMNVLLTSGYTESTVLGKIDLPTDVHLLSKPYSNSELARVIGDAISTPTR